MYTDIRGKCNKVSLSKPHIRIVYVIKATIYSSVQVDTCVLKGGDMKINKESSCYTESSLS